MGVDHVSNVERKKNIIMQMNPINLTHFIITD